jgi:hypothetical protein
MDIPHILRIVATTSVALALASCGGSGGDGVSESTTNASSTVLKVASCATGDKPESGLQGQVPAALRASGFGGFNCNLSLIGQEAGEGGNWSSATYTDKNGRTCAYHATAVPNANRKNPGVPVIDITDPTKPLRTATLTTPAMTDPWESLRVHDGRKILIADNGQNGGGGPEVDIYDVSADCRTPQLLASVPVGTGTDGGVQLPKKPVGHEGNISPDGLTYYIGDITNASYHAVDITVASKPKLIATYPIANLKLKAGTTVHGLSVSNDGNRLYAVILGGPPFGTAAVLAPAEINNGFAVFDTSEVQQRKPNAQIKLISTTLFQDGSFAQHTIPVTIGKSPYLVMVDEGGSAGLADAAAARAACNAGLAPFPMARIYDMSNEKQPVLVSKLALETHDPKRCDQVIPDITGLSIFTYGSHYCSVDNRDNSTALACSYFNSGVRVFDIRTPSKPREIAYFNPPSTTAKAGSSHAVFNQWRAGGPDWCASRLDFDQAKRRLVTMCQDNGQMTMQFAPGVWPFAESTPSTNQN